MEWRDRAADQPLQEVRLTKSYYVLRYRHRSNPVSVLSLDRGCTPLCICYVYMSPVRCTVYVSNGMCRAGRADVYNVTSALSLERETYEVSRVMKSQDFY